MLRKIFLLLALAAFAHGAASGNAEAKKAG